MATNFPTSADDSSTLPNPTAVNNTNSPSLSSGQSNQNDAIKAVQAKLGTGASTPASNTFLIGNGTGTSAYSALTSAQVAARVSDETGTGALVFASTPTLVTPKVDTINESTPANGVTIDGLNIKDGALTTANSTPTGSVVQVVDAMFSAAATGTTLIPLDDTIPQITEGTEVMTLAITPKSTTNKLVIEAIAIASVGAANETIIAALFQDSTANALSAVPSWQATSGGINVIPLRHELTAGTTSSTTFRVRVGHTAAGTMTFNGTGGGRLFGAITKSSIKITEYKA